jgi:uncharacterized membrane protein
MDSTPKTPPPSPDPRASVGVPLLRKFWKNLCDGVLGGLILVMPFLITFYIIWWIYRILEKNIIDPLVGVILWKLKWTTSSTELPSWFENFAAPLVSIVIALALLYLCNYLSDTRLRWAFVWMLTRVPIISQIYNPLRKMFQTLNNPSGGQRPQRLVLVQFPHPGMKLPAFVTARCRDSETKKDLLCVYVPTTPVPTSGFFLLVPEEEVTELNWDSEQTLQAIMSGGLTAPPEVSYYKSRPVNDAKPLPILALGDTPAARQEGDQGHPA